MKKDSENHKKIKICAICIDVEKNDPFLFIMHKNAYGEKKTQKPQKPYVLAENAILKKR